MTPNTLSFADLLTSAVTDPGVVSNAYQKFHNYSLGNMLLAWAQCLERGIQPGPMATYPRWIELGRQVRKGEKALVLCQPVTVKRTPAEGSEDEAAVFTRFTYRPRWFVLAQTDGAELPAATLPTWDRARALTALEITEVPFDLLDGNCQGFARQRSIAVSPIAALPFKTTLHEVGHIVLGHTAEGECADSDITPRSLREVEAECVAMLCCAALELPGIAEARGYVQYWAAGNPIPERSAQRILKAADQILKAGASESAGDVAQA